MSWREALRGSFRDPVVVAITAVVAAFVFVPSVTGGWIYDDGPLIAGNEHVHSFAGWTRWFTKDFWHLDEEFVRYQPRIVYWRPLVSASYALDWKISGGAPPWFHITNLVWHAAASALGFVVLRRWLGGGLAAAFAAALLWAVHPTKAESVAWISGRTDILCMVAILLVCQGIARRLAGRRGGLALEVAGTVLAYTCKEQAIVLPAFAAIESWVALGRPGLDRSAVLRMLRDAAPQLAIAIVYLGLRAAFMPIEAANVAGTIAPGDHVLIVAESFGRYLELTFAPHDLSVQQGLLDVARGELVLSMPHVIAGIAGVLGLIAAAIAVRKRAPIVTIGIALYLFTLLPTSNIVYAQMRTLISERFLYLPVFGIALVAGWALDRARVGSRWALAGAFVVAASALSLSHAADFHDEATFWARELELHPASYQARRMVVTQQIHERRFSDAMLGILQLHALSVRDRIEVAYMLAQIVAGLVPDRDHASLEAIDRFCADLVAGKPPAAELAVRELRYTMPTTARNYAAELEGYKLRLLVLRADLASRLGDDTRAVALAREALAECPRCVSIASIGGLAIARAGHYDEASKLLDNANRPAETAPIRKMIVEAVTARDRALNAQGPAQLQARASELAALELWGRAYDVLAPYKDQIKTAPRAVLGFAELAVRAGEPAVAREVLAGHPAAEVEEQITAWSKKMGWQ